MQDIFTACLPAYAEQIPPSQENRTLVALVRAMADWVHCSSRVRLERGFTPAQQRACDALPAPESQVASYECMAGACAFVKRVERRQH